MPKFLAKAHYNADGARALMKEGGSSRVAAVTKAAKAIGGKVESSASPAEFAAQIKDEIAVDKTMVTKLGLKPE